MEANQGEVSFLKVIQLSELRLSRPIPLSGQLCQCQARISPTHTLCGTGAVSAMRFLEHMTTRLPLSLPCVCSSELTLGKGHKWRLQTLQVHFPTSPPFLPSVSLTFELQAVGAAPARRSVHTTPTWLLPGLRFCTQWIVTRGNPPGKMDLHTHRTSWTLSPGWTRSQRLKIPFRWHHH